MVKPTPTNSKKVKHAGTKFLKKVFRSTSEDSYLSQIDYSSERIDLRGRGLRNIPEEITFQNHLTWIQLSQNQICKLPSGIGNLENLKTLRLFSNQIESFPPEIGKLKNLTTLDVGKNCIQYICPELFNCSNLIELNFQYNLISELPVGLGNLKNLKVLNLYINHLKIIPSIIGELEKLEELDISHNRLSNLPNEIGKLCNLTNLSLIGNRFKSIPVELSNLQLLSKLDLRCNLLSNIPSSLCELSNLRILLLRNNNIIKLPDNFGKLKQLNELRIEDNNIKKLPKSFGKLENLRLFHIFNNKLKSFPSSVHNLSSLIELDASYNQLSTLPSDFSKLKSLERLYLSYNQFKEIPLCVKKLEHLIDLEFIGNEINVINGSLFKKKGLCSLTQLNLNKNNITSLPNEISSLNSLISFEIADNKLEFIPETISGLSSLTFLNISHNLLSNLPLNFIKLKELRKLYISYNNFKINDNMNWESIVSSFTLLEDFICVGNSFKLIPSFIYYFINLKYLDLSGNDIINIDDHIGKLNKLKSLYLTGNKISGDNNISDNLGSLTSLTELDLSNNNIYTLPKTFSKLIHLTDIDLSRNNISDLHSHDFKDFDTLSQFKIAHNKITILPKFEISTTSDILPWISLEMNSNQLKFPKKGKYNSRGFESLYKFKPKYLQLKKSPLISYNKETKYIFTPGWSEIRGRRSDQQDTICILNQFRGSPNEYYFAVFDGHGGTISSELAANCLHYKFIESLNQYENTNPDPYNASIPFIQSFENFQNELNIRNVSDGTAANIIFIKNNIMYVANAGDSRSVLFRNSGAYPLSFDHKPENLDEKERIEAAGGFITESKRVNGILALSRALGDCDMQPPITYKPVITKTELKEDDKFIIMACDGLWDMLSNEKAVELISDCNSPTDAAVKLRDYAYTLGSADNISVVVIKIEYK